MELIAGSAALAQRLEDSDARNAALAAEAEQRLRPFAGEAVISVAGGMAAFAGVGSPLTHAIGIGMRGPVTEADIDEIERFFFTRESNVNIDLCPLADSSLAEHLGRRGYRPVEFNNILVRRVGPSVEFEDPRVEQVRIETVEEWAHLLAVGFFEHSPTEEELHIGRNLFAMEGASAFLVRIDGLAAAGGAMAIHSGLATLFGDATLKEYRGRGLQTLLIGARLAHASANSADMATAATLPGTTSQRNYERRGFGVAYTKINMQRDYPG